MPARLGRFGAVSVRAQMEMPPAPEAAVIDQHLLEHSLTVSKQFAEYLGRHGMHDREKVRESGAAFVLVSPAVEDVHRGKRRTSLTVSF
jgi:hypothetical protein